MDEMADLTNKDTTEKITLADLHAKFGWEEYLVLAATLTVSGLIGVFWAWRSRKAKEQPNNYFIVKQYYKCRQSFK